MITDPASLVQMNRALPSVRKLTTFSKTELNRMLNKTSRRVLVSDTTSLVEINRALGRMVR